MFKEVTPIKKEYTDEDKRPEYEPITWSEDNLVMFLDGYAWTALPMDGHVEHLCLGKEEDVKAILAGQEPISEAKGTKQQIALKEILETKEDQDARPAETRGRSSKRTRPIGVTRHRQKDPRRLKARKRLPRR